MGVAYRRKSTFTTAPAACRRTPSRRGRVRTGCFGFARKIYDGDADTCGQSLGRTATASGNLVVAECCVCVCAARFQEKAPLCRRATRAGSVRALLPLLAPGDVMIVARNVGRARAAQSTKTLRSEEMIIVQSRVPRSDFNPGDFFVDDKRRAVRANCWVIAFPMRMVT